jgi:zinc protease
MRAPLSLAVLLLAPVMLAAGPADFRRTVLDNGLTVLVQEDHGVPLVSVAIMYAAGARNEAAGQTGIAHYVEHMNFRASARFPGSENTESITRLGGRWDGYTWIDQTYYAATVPREALGLALDIEADRMTAAAFDPGEFDKERTSVIAELHSYDDPQSLLYDAVLAASFQLHPYRNNTIGFLTDVEQVTRDEAFRFYRRFYHPRNAVLAIVGDVDAAAAVEEVRRRFGAVASGGERGEVRTVEPEQDGQRRVVVRRPGPHALLMAAWRAPALREADFAAMVLFDALVAGGKGFRFTREYAAPPETPLERALVGAGHATRASSDWQAARYPYVYTLQAAVTPAQGLGAAEEALFRLLSEAATREWTDTELTAARRQIRAGWAADLDDLAGRAHQLAFFEISGGAELLGSLPQQIGRVTRDDLRRFARDRLRPEQATVGWFVPVSEAPATEARLAAAVSPTPPAAPPVPAPAPAAAAALAAAPVAFTLGNGARVRVVPGGGAGLVAVRARLDVGPPSDATGAALAALLAERLSRPAAGEPPSSAGLSLTLHDDPQAFGSFRWIEMSARGLADDVRDALGVLARRLEEIARPIDARAWATVVKAAQGRAREHGESAETALWARALAELYPVGSGLAGPPWGSAQALGALAADELLAFSRARARPARLYVVLAGAIDEAAARSALEASLGRWSGASPDGGPPSAPIPSPRGPAQWTERVVARPEKGQNDILVVWPGDRATDADRAATKALLYLLGETGYAGRLGHALVDPGLAYSVHTTLQEAPGAPGFLAVRTASSHKDTRETLRRIREVLEGAARGAFTRAELDEAKTYLRGRDLLRRQGSEDAAATTMEDATDPRRFDPQALTLAQLNATARRLFRGGSPVALVLGPGLD